MSREYVAAGTRRAACSSVGQADGDPRSPGRGGLGE